MYRTLRLDFDSISQISLQDWTFSNENIEQLAAVLKWTHKQQLRKTNESANINQAQNATSDGILKVKNDAGNSEFVENHPPYKSDDTFSLEFDMRTIDWEEYYCHYLPGMKRYCLKEPFVIPEKCNKHNFQYVFLIIIRLIHSANSLSITDSPHSNQQYSHWF